MKFVADEMLGRSSRWLRMIGCDVKYFKVSDNDLLEVAQREDRILLTRDLELFRRAKNRGLETFFIEGQNGRGDLETNVRLVEPVNDKFEKSHLVFTWKDHKGANSYALDLFDESLRLIWKSPNLRETQYHLPPDIIQKLEPNHAYFWMITVAMQNGTIIESPLANFFLVQ